ncbi:MAG: insulinase family protein, partial [Vicinamibacteria bacterium]|nr:insulinase family protein [Vicinamibacteria bacterium]
MKTIERRLSLCLTLSGLWALALPAFAEITDVRTHVLRNGMQVITQEDRSIPSVALYVFYRIGSR